jgi:hypothetical protein
METHLAWSQTDGMQLTIVVLDLNWPGLVVVVVFVGNVHDRGDDVGVWLKKVKTCEVLHKDF